MNPLFRLRSLFRRSTLDAEMAEEMRAHLEEQTRCNTAAGMASSEARHVATRQFGNASSLQERCREARGWTRVTQWVKDLRFAGRALRRSPGFSLAVFFTLALCLGPNIAILSVLHALVLKPLPFRDANQLVQVQNRYDRRSAANPAASFEQYREFKAHADQFAGFALVAISNATFGEESAPVRVQGYTVTPDLFSVLGLNPVAGRFFTVDEQPADNNHVIVLTQAFWQENYASDPTVLGRTVRMGGESFTIVGIAPPALDALLRGAQVLRPYGVELWESRNDDRYATNGMLLGRLKPGVDLAAGQAQLTGLERQYYDERASPQTRRFLDTGGHRIAAGPLGEQDAIAVKTPLLLLQGGGLFVLLIGCLNVANLMLARSSAKRSEFVLRHALGAGAAALLRYMLCESLLLVLAAGGAGVMLAGGALATINRYLPLIVRLAPEVSLDYRVLVAAWVAAFGIAAFVALLPFWLLWRSELRVATTRVASTDANIRTLSSALVIAQVAVALVLLVGSGLLIRSFAHVMAIAPGFAASEIVQGRIAVPKTYFPREKGYPLQQRLLAALREIPGVEAAALVADFGVAKSYRTSLITVLGRAAEGGANRPFAYLQFVSPEYFATMGIPILEGRGFSEADNRDLTPTVVVDQEFVARYLGGQPAVGQELAAGTEAPAPGKPGSRIIGVAARAYVTGVERRDGPPTVYLAINNLTNPGFNVLVRSPRDAGSILGEIRAKLRATDPTLPLYQTGTLQEGLDGMLVNRRGFTLLLAGFALVALILAAIGLYGVLAYDVSQREREIGIRGALGASRRQIVGLVLRQGCGRTAIGLAVGLVGAFSLTRYLRSMLFDVSATDPLSFAAVAMVLFVVAVLASWLPARRAAKVDPVIALRSE